MTTMPPGGCRWSRPPRGSAASGWRASGFSRSRSAPGSSSRRSGRWRRTRTAIRTLRLVGAEDGFIARGFARRLTLRAAAGALAGTAAAMVLVALLPRASEPGFFLVGIGLSGWQWLLPLLVPAAAGAIAWGAAWAATRRALRRWS